MRVTHFPTSGQVLWAVVRHRDWRRLPPEGVGALIMSNNLVPKIGGEMSRSIWKSLTLQGVTAQTLALGTLAVAQTTDRRRPPFRFTHRQDRSPAMRHCPADLNPPPLVVAIAQPLIKQRRSVGLG